jgi:hypothetical protein
MNCSGQEIIEPEELARLGKVFDEAWAAVSHTGGEDTVDQRTSLAVILLRLAYLRQLGPDQMKATAVRIFRSEVGGDADRMLCGEVVGWVKSAPTTHPSLGS